jgi:hypothetical protein
MRAERLQAEHGLVFGLTDDGERSVTGCRCGFEADSEVDRGYGDSVVRHLFFDVARAACRCPMIDAYLAAPGAAVAVGVSFMCPVHGDRTAEVGSARAARFTRDGWDEALTRHPDRDELFPPQPPATGWKLARQTVGDWVSNARTRLALWIAPWLEIR